MEHGYIEREAVEVVCDKAPEYHPAASMLTCPMPDSTVVIDPSGRDISP